MGLRGWLARIWKPKTLGQRGEAAAARRLRKLGCKIVARSDRAVLGEIDLVAVDGRTIVFVEVKTRRNSDAGHPADAVDANKQRRLCRLALGFLKRHDLLGCPVRFDVVAVTWPLRGSPLIEHFPAAFESQGMDGMYG